MLICIWRLLDWCCCRPYNETEAQLRQSLGLAVVRRLHRCITVSVHPSAPYHHLAVLFYPQDVFLVDLQSEAAAAAERPRDPTPQQQQQQPLRILLHISVPLIREIILGPQGVTVRTAVAAAAPQRPEEALARASSSEALSPKDLQRQQTARAAPKGELRATYHIPCSTAALANEVYQELLETQRGNSSVVYLGENTAASFQTD